MAKTIKMEVNGKNGLNEFTGYENGFTSYIVNYCHDKAEKKTYNSWSKYTFSRPSKDCFYMRVLRRLIASSATKKDLGSLERNKDAFTAMRSAGLIDYAYSDRTWNITAVGKNYYYKAMKLLNK